MKINLFYTLLLCLLVGTLFNAEGFGNPTLLSFFAFTITGFLFSLAVAVRSVIAKVSFIADSKALILIGILAVYVCSSEIISRHALGMFSTYILCAFVLLISLQLFFLQFPGKKRALLKAIEIIAVVESVICILQAAGILPNPNHFFTVSGTWINPNVTAIFLALAFAAVLLSFLNEEGFSKKLSAASGIAIIAALFLLKCRTAFIGLSVITVVILNAKYGAWVLVDKKYKGVKVSMLAAGLVIVIACSVFGLLKIKQASAEGRLLVWKVSGMLISKHPVFGVGYGNFQQAYNLEQAQYFHDGKGTAEEVQNSGTVHSAYNEYLQNFVEGGIIGFTLFSGLFIFLLWKGRRQLAWLTGARLNVPQSVAAYAALLAFAIMSLVNFTIMAIPAMCLAIIYLAVLNVQVSSIGFSSRYNGRYLLIPLSVMCFLFFAKQVIVSVGYRQAALIAKTNDKRVMENFERLSSIMHSSDFYLVNYGIALQSRGRYAESINKFKAAALLTSSDQIYMLLGDAYMLNHDPENAMHSYTVAKDMRPSKLKPRYALMQLCLSEKDSVHATVYAQEIVGLPVKVQSREALFYKKNAQALLTPISTAKSVSHE